MYIHLLFSRAGLSNYLYLCTLPSNQKLTSTEPKEVLLRVYGEIFYEGDAPLLDTVVFSLLSERRQAPKLYGVFREGRLEQYIPVSFKIYSKIVSKNGCPTMKKFKGTFIVGASYAFSWEQKITSLSKIDCCVNSL